MYVGHWTPTFELLAPSAVKLVFYEEQPRLENVYILPEAKKIKDEVCA